MAALNAVKEKVVPISSAEVVEQLWRTGAADPEALGHLQLTGEEPCLPSSFLVGTAAQSAIAAAALAAAEVRATRGKGRQKVSVDMIHAAQECSNYLSLDGVVPEVWDKFSGIYPCGKDGAAGWVRIHANFKHHREGALTLLGCSIDGSADKADVGRALENWTALDFEEAAAKAKLVVAAARSFEEWDRHPQSIAIKDLPVFTIEKIGEAAPLPLSQLRADSLPLEGVRVLDLTRILAGPVAGRTLAAYGADVMLVNSPKLPNIDAIAETSRGKLSVELDLQTAAGRENLKSLVGQSHMFVQGYHPGGLAALGFSPEELAALRPGLVYVSLSAYGHQGPWAERRGFDSLVQTTTGFNFAEAAAAGTSTPKALPVQILDHASGYLMAFAAQLALIRQQREGGSWHVRVSLAQTAQWLRGLGRQAEGLKATRPPIDSFLEQSDSGFGKLVAVSHSAKFSVTPAKWNRPSMPPGSHPAAWRDHSV